MNQKKFLLRLPPELFGALEAEAKRSKLSLNSFLISKLERSSQLKTTDADRLAELITKFSVFKQSPNLLIGIILFGSVARGEATERSDIDVLIVVDSSMKLNRALYRIWDQEMNSPQWNGYPLSPHFVHPPDFNDLSSVGSLWLEAALEGIILFDERRTISQILRTLRMYCLSGQFKRHMSHGVPYWSSYAEKKGEHAQ